jgi:hypothetical protein
MYFSKEKTSRKKAYRIYFQSNNNRTQVYRFTDMMKFDLTLSRFKSLNLHFFVIFKKKLTFASLIKGT